MNAIADFKKRREAERAKAANKAPEKADTAKAETKAPENEALTLLAKLLNCEPENAIAKAKELIEHAESEGLDFVIGLGGETLEELALDTDEDGTENNGNEDGTENVTEPGDKAGQTATDLDASAGAVEDAAANVAGAADTVDAAADKVSDAAGGLEDTANQLAYSAEDIGTATAELKEATAELKKPSAGRQSSRGKTTGKPKASSKKSG
jgi:methyl-accepting chemotaxis protein